MSNNDDDDDHDQTRGMGTLASGATNGGHVSNDKEEK
jgi:hypothetical protein